ncbi:hypothetical protein BST81_08430 [Leptolyngbya sp. 'hensonii']|uniref:zinc ribbon domain-containing protein n=1 Tax=Leptolyngbya sp. 'hensonii' TaxID=1922337 RepID=UPI00094F661E|nr:zinc ribbon domain-containing protein [Leptolyngbya sp. 'hensonii']OLP18929.1 hypothetical protein BST81_08430 [Leptolyngbya sp. 'hensonii']
MAECPYCHQRVDTQAVVCPSCRKPLKAYGHPGIPLHRAQGDASLCQTCAYHADDTCTFPQRPLARDCTLYVDVNQPQPQPPVYRLSPTQAAIGWIQRHLVWVVLVALIGLSLALALANSKR